MAELLFLIHRTPFPPEKGDKIRSWHILRHLARRHRIHLGCFFDDPADEQHIGALEEICASVCCLPLKPVPARLRSLSGLLTGTSLSAGYFRDARLTRWIGETMRLHRPDHAFVYCSAMAPYLDPHRFASRVIDMVDVDSEKWRQYAATSRWPLDRLYRREGRTLLALERRAAADFDRTLFVSAAEARLFLAQAPEAAARVAVLGNGVDHDFFRPDAAYPDPYAGRRPAIAFTGAMDYRPNAEAAQWFAGAVMPLLRAQGTSVDFWIVGAHPTAAVQRLAAGDIHVTGRVPDIRPYIARAAAVVAPLRIARGVQNKVLEGMALARPVIATPAALEGLDLRVGGEVLAAAGAADFAAQIALVLSGGAVALGERARARVVQDYAWATQLRPLDALFTDGTSRALPASRLAGAR